MVYEYIYEVSKNQDIATYTIVFVLHLNNMNL